MVTEIVCVCVHAHTQLKSLAHYIKTVTRILGSLFGRHFIQVAIKNKIKLKKEAWILVLGMQT